MSQAIELSNGEFLTPLCFQDALDAVEELAGRDLREFIEEYLQDNIDEETAKRLEIEENLKDFLADPDTHQDLTKEQSWWVNAQSYRVILLAIREELDQVSDKLNEKAIDRTALEKRIRSICKVVNEVL